MMKRMWSPRWLSSIQPRKQRKYRYNAPLHVRQRFVSANLSPELRKRFSVRSMHLRKGDEVRVMRGGLKGKNGTVDRVDLSGGKIYTEEIKTKKVDGSEVPMGIQPSNLMITKLKLDDKRRQAILDRVGEPGRARPAGTESEAASGRQPGKARAATRDRKGEARPDKKGAPARKGLA